MKRWVLIFSEIIVFILTASKLYLQDASVVFSTLWKPASKKKLVWSLWQRLGIHHSINVLLPSSLCQKYIIKILPVCLFKETSVCAMWQPAVRRQLSEHSALFFLQRSGFTYCLSLVGCLPEQSLWMQFFMQMILSFKSLEDLWTTRKFFKPWVL